MAARNASSGHSTRNEAKGKNSVCMAAGEYSSCKVAIGGCIALMYIDKTGRPRIVTGHVGEDIEADTWYKVENGKLVKVI